MLRRVEGLKRLLEGLVEGKAPGPSPSFSVFHLLKALELIAREYSIGRGRLAEELKIGEGATRTLIDRLREAELVVVSKKGCSLTEGGQELWRSIQSIFRGRARLDRSELTLAPYNVAFHIKGLGSKVVSGMEQRDAAIKVGAKGATTLVFKSGKLVLPKVSENVAQDFPAVFLQIVEQLRLEEGDVVVIGSADGSEEAEYGALAAAWTFIADNHG